MEIHICFKKNGKTIFEVPEFVVPDGARIRGCYKTKSEVIITGDPEPNEAYNCDQMGCSIISHVLYRFLKM
jgi:hypothetical protein